MRDKRVDDLEPKVSKLDEVVPRVEELVALPQMFQEFVEATTRDFQDLKDGITDLVTQLSNKIDLQDAQLIEMLETLGLEVDALRADGNAYREANKEILQRVKDIDKAFVSFVERGRRAFDPMKIWPRNDDVSADRST